MNSWFNSSFYFWPFIVNILVHHEFLAPCLNFPKFGPMLLFPSSICGSELQSCLLSSSTLLFIYLRLCPAVHLNSRFCSKVFRSLVLAIKSSGLLINLYWQTYQRPTDHLLQAFRGANWLTSRIWHSYHHFTYHSWPVQLMCFLFNN